MKFIKAACICSVLFSACPSQGLALTEELPALPQPTYSITVDTEKSDFENGSWKYRLTTENGISLLLTEGEKPPFLLINGSISDLPVWIENGVSFVPLEGISTALPISVRQIKNYGIQTKERDGTQYVPLRQVCAALGCDLTYTKGDLPAMPMATSWICADTREKKISKEKAMQIAKQGIRLCFEKYIPQEDFAAHFDVPQNLKAIEKRIDATEYLGETASFWLFKGPYLLLLDKTTGTLYYKTGGSNAGHGSYRETLEKADLQKTDTFNQILLQGFSI